MIGADELRDRLAGLVEIGRDDAGTTRLAWSPELAAAEDWFRAQARSIGRRVLRDPAGSLWAVPAADPPWRATGSHLDSVRCGGRFDGALGVAAGFAVAQRSPDLAVIAFADEEGARFNTPTFGSRALAGRLDVAAVLARRDDDGITLAAAMRAFGVDPDALADAPGWRSRLAAFVELHIDQTRTLEQAGAAAGAVSSLAARTRLALTLRGRADHAGTTGRGERRDALAAAARVIVAADELGSAGPQTVVGGSAEPSRPAGGSAGPQIVAGGSAEPSGSARGSDEVLVTASRLLVEPNAFTTVPSLVRLWIDARTPAPDRLDAWERDLRAAAAALAAGSGVEIAIEVASRSDGVAFDAELTARLGALPPLVCFAGHDAGILAPHLPAAMVFVRNPTGISHAPEEEIDMQDAATAATAMLGALR